MALFTFVVAAWSTGPGPHWLDSGEFVAATRWLALPHPPGHPLYPLATLPFALLPVGSLAARSSWASAFWLSLAWGALVWASERVLRRSLGLSRLDAALVVAVPALTGALSAASLLQGARAEVYALHAALLAGALALLLGLRGPRSRLLAALFVGLALANHHYLVFLAGPGFLLLYHHAGTTALPSGGPSWRRTLSSLPGAALLVALGLTCYLYLPLRTLSDAPFAWGEPTSPERFYWVISAQVFQKAVRTGGVGLLSNLGEAFLLLMEQLHPLGLIAALVGAGLWLRRAPWAAAGLVLVVLGTVLSQSLMTLDPYNPDLLGYFLFAVMVLALSASYCLGWLVAALRSLLARRAELQAGARAARWIRPALALMAIVLGLRSFSFASEPRSFREVHAPSVISSALLEDLPPHSIVLSSDFSTIFLLWALQAVDEARPDVVVVHRNFLPFPGWLDRERRLHPELATWLTDLGEDGELRSSAPRPLFVEPYHNLGAPECLKLQPTGLLHRVGPAQQDQALAPSAWATLTEALSPQELEDPQTRRYVFWQAVLQGSQRVCDGDPRGALREWLRAHELAPESPEVLQSVKKLLARFPELAEEIDLPPTLR